MIESFSFKKRKKRPSLRRIVLFTVLLFCLVFVFINRTLCPAIISLAIAESKNRVTNDLSATVYDVLGKDGIPYDSLFSVSYQSDGSVAAMNVNMGRAYAICAEVIPMLSQRIRSENTYHIAVPAGTLSGIPAFSGKGPSCTVRIVFAKAIRVRMESDFIEAGINQTLHKLSMVVTAEVTLLIPGASTDVINEVKVPIAETVLLGKVPDAYTEIHRLTDDITETEIDDIYDFGAQ